MRAQIPKTLQNTKKSTSKRNAANNTLKLLSFFQLLSLLYLPLHTKNLITLTTQKHPIPPFSLSDTKPPSFDDENNH